MPRSRKLIEQAATLTLTCRWPGFGSGTSALVSDSIPPPLFGIRYARIRFLLLDVQEILGPPGIIRLPQQLLLQIGRRHVLELRWLHAFAQRLQRIVNALHASPELMMALQADAHLARCE